MHGIARKNARLGMGKTLRKSGEKEDAGKTARIIWQWGGFKREKIGNGQKEDKRFKSKDGAGVLH